MTNITFLGSMGVVFIALLVLAVIVTIWITCQEGLLQRRRRIRSEAQAEIAEQQKEFLLEAAEWMSECSATQRLLKDLAYDDGDGELGHYRRVWRKALGRDDD